jgi:hypothetical protein
MDQMQKSLTPLPSLLFNAVLKSASSYITDMLLRGLNAKRCFITVGVFPGDLILFEKIQGFAAGGQVAQQHFPASPENLAYLRQFALPLIVHARDPRAVIVSWTHHLAGAKGGLAELFWYYPAICPPASFLDQPFAWQFDWCLEHHFPQFLAWLDGWRTAAELGLARPLFTTFEEFIADRRGFFNSLLDQAGIPNAAFKDPELPAGAAHLFRRGLVDEWRTIMDASQARKATDAVPTQLWSLFRWKP